MDERLVGGGQRQEEMGVEALRHEVGRDPMGEGHERVERRREPFPRHEIGEGRGAVERGRAGGRHEPVLALGSRQQHPAFLERLADRRHLEGGERIGRRGDNLRVRRLHPAAGKDQRPRGEVDLMMAHDHEGLQPRGPVAQQQDRGGGTGRDGGGRFGHARARSISLKRKRWILPVAVFGNSATNSMARGYL